MTACDPPYHRLDCSGGCDRVFDDVAFDAEIEVERLGIAEFRRRDLADVLGVSPRSIWTLVARGKLPPPDHREVGERAEGRHGGAGSNDGVWSKRQVVKILADRKRGH